MYSQAPATFNIVLLTVVISLLALKVYPQWLQFCIFRPYYFLREKQYFTILSSGFVHGSGMHLLFNMMTLYFFGPVLERVIGSGAFVVLYTLALMLSEVRTYWQQRHHRFYAALGASGGVCAILFASIVYFPMQSIFIMPIPVPIPAPIFAVCYLIYSWYFEKRGGDNINHAAHIDGAIVGLLFVAVTDLDAYRKLLEML